MARHVSAERKRIVICCDGTWNTPEQQHDGHAAPTNVVKAARAVRPRDDAGVPQVVFYDPGVGTYPGLDRWIGGAFGSGLGRNVRDAYRFLVHNYEEGDEIFLFGFSRGAFTARSTVGMIRNCGILKKSASGRIPEAYDLYRNREIHPDHQESRRFREAFARATPHALVRFLGVWDTVGALGVPLEACDPWNRKHQFHDMKLSSIVAHACHALAIDERRRSFRPAIWDPAPDDGRVQTVEQVWFAGVHCDVGGGYGVAGASDVALWWMLDRAEACGLALDQAYLDENVHPAHDGELHDSLRGVYRLMGTHDRQIGERDPAHEQVHSSVHARRQGDPSYGPDNLIAHLQQPAAERDSAGDGGPSRAA